MDTIYHLELTEFNSPLHSYDDYLIK